VVVRPAEAGQRDRAQRRFVLDQRIRYSYSSPITDLHQYLRVVPPPAHGGQHRRHWSLTAGGVASSRMQESIDSFGNLVVVTDVPHVGDAVDFIVHVEADIDDGSTVHAVAADPRYHWATPLTTADGAITELALADPPRTSRHGSPLDHLDVESICDRVHRAITYGWGITGVDTTASAALAGGVGVCQDYAHIMLAACRRAGIAARYVSGHLVGEGGSHAWVEVLHPSDTSAGTWLAEAWDPTHNRRVDGDYLVVAVGRDYRDAAPMAGTFVGEGVTGNLVVEKRLSA
jgi:transglutaminase-like putative cysteine protease